MTKNNEFERLTPEQAGISSLKVLEFLDRLKKTGIEVHSLMLLRHGKIFAESWWAPYNSESRHIMFSFTKSLTSTAIGFACQEGLMNLDDRLIDIFPDKIPETPSENLKKCAIRHLLSMSCGHENEIENLGMGSSDWIKEFLSHEFKYEPGTHFMYNTAGTNMLSAVITRKTGETLMAFLKPRLFDKLGIGDVPCYSLPDGVQVGGAGSRLKTEEMARFIQFVANRGEWNGEQLLSSAWFDLATSKQIENAETSVIPDWQQGYGFQFWRCVPECVFRADGAFGQFGIVCPKQDAVIVMTSASSNFHCVLATLWETLLPYFAQSPLPEDHESQTILSYVLSHNQLTPIYGTRSLTAKASYGGATYIPDKKISGGWADFIGGAGISSRGAFAGIISPYSNDDLTSVRVEMDDNSVRLIALVGDCEETLPISLESRFNSFLLSGKVYGACGGWLSNEVFEFVVQCAEAASGKRYFAVFSQDQLTLTAFSTMPDFGGLNDDREDKIIFNRKKSEN